jgi:glycosyltransferase involved in cell wall biosynthesis
MIGARDRFVFGFQFDWNSSRRRKNPDGVLGAYLRAFPNPDSGTLLLIKTINGEQHPESVRQFAAVADGRPDVVIIDDFWPTGLNAALSQAIDCYVSLHRAEGFGLTIAKAMAAGKPVIATGYSGNLDFMPAGTSLLVPWTLTLVGPDPIYPAQAHWAEPDLDSAVDCMRSVFDDAALRADLGARAEEHIRLTRSEDLSVEWVRQRLAEDRA